MQILCSPVRLDDFTHSCNALREWMERFTALDRLSLDRITPGHFGFGFLFKGTDRFRTWWFERPEITAHAGWLESTEVDHFGNYLIRNRQLSAQIPGGMFGAVCSWQLRSEAATWLRTTCIGPLLWETYGPATLEVYTTDILRGLDISEGSFNSAPPCWCTTRWGKMLRVDAQNADRVLSYLLIDHPSSQARLVELGAQTTAGIASDSTGELRISLGRRWHDDLLVRDLERWRKASVPRSRKKEAAR